MRWKRYFLIIPIILQLFVHNAHSQSVEELRANFYNTEKFLHIINNYPESERDGILNSLAFEHQIFSSPADRAFDKKLWEFLNVADGTSELSSIFHIYTNYYYYSYDNLNQFEKKRLVSTHKKEIADRSFLKSIRNDFYFDIKVDGSELGEFNFDKKTFTIDLADLFGEQSYNLANMSTIDKVLPGYSYHYKVSLKALNSKPVRIIIDNIYQAESLNKSSFTLRFFISASNKIFKDFKINDVSTYEFEAYKEKYLELMKKGYRKSDFSDSTMLTIISIYGKDDVAKNTIIMAYFVDTKGVFGPAIDRYKYFRQDIIINQVEMIPSLLEQNIWRSPEYYKLVSRLGIDSFFSKIETDKAAILEEKKNKEAAKERARQFKEVIEQRKNLLKDDPNIDWHQKAANSFTEKNYNDAIEYWEIGILQQNYMLSGMRVTRNNVAERSVLYSNIQSNYYNIGGAYVNIDMLDSALNKYKESINACNCLYKDKDQLVIKSKIRIANIFDSMGETGTAITQLLSIINYKYSDDVNMSLALNGMGHIYRGSGEYEKAYEYYERTVKVVGSTKVGYYPFVKSREEDYKDSDIMYEEVVKSYFFMAEIEALSKNYKHSLVLMQYSIDHSKSNHHKYRARLRKGAYYSEIEDYKKSIKEYNKAGKLYQKVDHGDSNPWGMIGWTYYLKGDYGKAIKESRKGFSTNPESDWIKYNIAIALLADGKYKEAETEYTEAKEQFGVIDGAIVDLKDLYTNKKRAEKAKYILTEILGVESE